jgi:hypothetical protein
VLTVATHGILQENKPKRKKIQLRKNKPSSDLMTEMQLTLTVIANGVSIF